MPPAASGRIGHSVDDRREQRMREAKSTLAPLYDLRVQRWVQGSQRIRIYLPEDGFIGVGECDQRDENVARRWGQLRDSAGNRVGQTSWQGKGFAGPDGRWMLEDVSADLESEERITSRDGKDLVELRPSERTLQPAQQQVIDVVKG